MEEKELVAALRRARYRLGTEAILQESIAEVLTELVGSDGFTKEAKIGPRERIDFLVKDGIGIEAKLKYPRRAIWRQIMRYAECKSIKSIILITGTATGLPKEYNGVNLYYVSLGLASL